MTHEKFEYKAVSMLLEGNDPIFERLFKQFLSAEVSKREETETGFLVHFKVPKYLAVDKITKQISGIRVMQKEAEVLSLELIVLEGLITQLNASYISEIKSLDLILRANDLTFSHVTSKTFVKLETALADHSELMGKVEQLSVENAQINELLAKRQARKSELVKNFEQLFSENSRTKELLEEEQVQNSELIEEIAKLLAERTQINKLLVQEQAQNLELVKKVNALKENLADVDPIEPKEEGKIEIENNKSSIESQREKRLPPSAKITDNFLSKIFGEKAAAEKYRRKTKYHIAVWKLAFTMGINTLFYLFFTASILIILLSGVQNTSGDSYRVMGFSALRVASASMEPRLPVNSLIVVRQKDPNDLKIGQIATYLREDGALITHRIYNVEKDDHGNNIGFTLRGDANSHLNNQIVSSENIVGQLVFDSYGIGRMLLFFETRFILMFVITIFLLTLLYIGKRRVVRRFTIQ